MKNQLNDDFITRALTKLPDSLVRLHRTGGVMLVFIFVGLICMAWAHFRTGNLSDQLFIVGAVVTISCLAIFVWQQIKEPLAIRRENKVSAAVENLAVELTKTVDALQSMSIKHSEYTDKVLGAAANPLPYLPQVRDELQRLGISNPSKIPKLVMDVSKLAREEIREIKNALSKKDPKILLKRARALSNIRQKMNRVLSPPERHEALIKAVARQDALWVRHLIEEGAPIDPIETGDNEVPLILAVECGHLEIVKLLLDAGCDPDVRGTQDRTALVLSVAKNQLEIMQALIIAKANVDFSDKSGRTPLMWAADTGNLSALKILIDAKADVEREDYSQLTALKRAQRKKFQNIIETLKTAGASEP